MIDSVTIRYELDCMEARTLIENMTITVPDTDERISSFLDPFDFSIWSINAYKSEDTSAISAGLINLRFYKHGYNYYFELSLHLEALIQGRKTNRLFVARPSNIAVLQDKYAEMIKRLFPSIVNYNANFIFDEKHKVFRQKDAKSYLTGISRIPYIGLCTVLRVDYTVNLYVEDKELYLYLLGKSFQEIDRMHLLDSPDNNNVRASTQSVKYDTEHLVKDHITGNMKPKAILSKSPYTKVNFYDKALKHRNKDCKDEELIAEAEHIVRFEVSYRRVHHWPEKRLREKLHVKYACICGLLPWLDEDVAMESLKSVYDRHIGNATYYKKYRFKKIIENADLGYTNKTAELKYKAKLIDLAELISRAHSVRLAKQQFIEGTTLGKPARIIHGTAAEFSKMIKDIISTGAMPLRLPEYKKAKEISVYENPFNQYIKGNPALPGYLYELNDSAIYIFDEHSLTTTLCYYGNCSLLERINDCNKGILSFADYNAERSKEEFEAYLQRLRTEVVIARLEQLIAEMDSLEAETS